MNAENHFNNDNDHYAEHGEILMVHSDDDDEDIDDEVIEEMIDEEDGVVNDTDEDVDENGMDVAASNGYSGVGLHHPHHQQMHQQMQQHPNNGDTLMMDNVNHVANHVNNQPQIIDANVQLHHQQHHPRQQPQQQINHQILQQQAQQQRQPSNVESNNENAQPRNNNDIEDTEPPLDGYERTNQIGRGAYGIVYKGIQRATNTTVAIKRIPFGESTPEGGVPCNVIREISLLRELDHPNVVRLLDVNQAQQGELYLVFEFVAHDLKTFMDRNQNSNDASRRHGLDTNTVRSFMRQILEGVGYCHTYRILHRDLKPHNVSLICMEFLALFFNHIDCSNTHLST
jgi:hypothetical protein